MAQEVKHMLRTTYRYSGVMNWEKIYAECKDYFVRVLGQRVDFTEIRYKHKNRQIQVNWDIKHNFDAYSQWWYKVTLKVVNPIHINKKVNGKVKRLVEGNLRMWLVYDYVGNYEWNQLAGSSQLFKQDSWLQKLYWKVTWRDRYDLAEDLGMFFTFDFTELMKKLCETEAGGYGSVGDPW